MIDTLWKLLLPYRGLALSPGRYPIVGQVPKNLFRKAVHYGVIQKDKGQWLIIKPKENLYE